VKMDRYDKIMLFLYIVKAAMIILTILFIVWVCSYLGELSANISV
jgi:hypothetical protein